MPSLAEKAVALHLALDAAALEHAFGGALALAWCTQQPRGTSDIDINVFVAPSSTTKVLASLPPEVARTKSDATLLRRHGQCRLRWETTPVDLFLNTGPFHREAMTHFHHEPFAGHMVPFLSCADLAVFKAVFDRRRDWADLEDMVRADSIDVDSVTAVLAAHLGDDDHRIDQLRALAVELG